ncbi:unnamed protein product, partial [marine sediment metagenome]
MAGIDLHIHTIFSDGTYTPEEAVFQAKKLGLVAISITDHDSVAGLGSALVAGKSLGIEIVPGVEMSTDVGEDEIHILGYFLNWKKEDWDGSSGAHNHHYLYYTGKWDSVSGTSVDC